MQHQASLTTPEENLTDVTIAIVNRAGAVVVAPTAAPLVAGTANCYRVVLTVPDSLSSGRERWASASAGFKDFDSDPIIFTQGVDLTPVLAAVAGAKTDTEIIIERIEERAPGGGPVDIWPAIPEGFDNYGVIAVDWSDFGVTRDGVVVEARLQGAVPFSADGSSFQVDGEVKARSGEAVTVGTTTYPATPGRAWLVLPKSSTVQDRTGATDLLWRFDSVGARINNQREAIQNRKLLVEEGGSLWQLLLEAEG